MLLPRLLSSLLIFAAASATARTLPLRRIEAKLTPLSIAEDRAGYLWMATDAGIMRFDGLRYEPVYPPSGYDVSAARQIAATPDGSIWIGTPKGLLRYRNGAWTRELAGEITALYVTRAGRILAVMAPDGHVRICLEPERYPGRWFSTANSSVAGRFHEDLEGRIWFGCGRNICFWSDEDVKSAAAGANFSSLPSIRIEQLGWADVVRAPDGRVWGRNGPSIVMLADGKIISRTAVPVGTYQSVRPGFLLDRRGRVWIPSHKLHVAEGGTLGEFSLGDPALDDVTIVFQDRRGTLWFGIAGEGLAAVPDEAAVESWFESEGIFGSVVDLAVHPRLGLVAAADTGAYVFQPRSNRWQALWPRKDPIALRSIASGPRGALLSLPHSAGLATSSAPFAGTHSLPLPADLSPRQLRKLFTDAQGATWLCTINGLFRMDRAGRIASIPLPGEPEAGTYASDLAAGTGGQVWVGYEGGVGRCSADGCEQVIGAADGLLNQRVRSIAPAAGEVWVAYRQTEAFSRFQRAEGRWTARHFLPESGYGPPDTHFIRRDRRGWIWRGSTDGVYVCDGRHVEPEDWIHLSFGDRVNASYANMYGFLEQPDGSIWIGTQKGVVRIHPGDDWFTTSPPTIFSAPSVSQRRGDLEIHLSRPGLPAFQSRQFRYRLLPADPKWRVSTDGMIRYARLPKGEYRIQVAAGAGRAPVEHVIRVSGPIAWRGPLAIFLALAAAGGLLWGRVRQRKVNAARAYWEEKRRFLENRDQERAEDWSGRTLEKRFLLEARIAAGGFASIYRAQDLANSAGMVAVKLLDPMRDNEEWRRRRFAEEVAALQKLNHPGIVRILHAGEAAPDQPYLAMEFIDGITLRELLGGGPLDFDRAANLLEQIGEALATAHHAGILHRDLKPENVMVAAAGSAEERIKLIDFGIARAQSEQVTRQTTQLAGSPGYIAPERWVGMESCASDIYSLAAVAWEMLTGESYQHGATHAPSMLPPAAAELLMAALSYDPQQRPQDAEALVRDLRAAWKPAGQPFKH